MRVVRGTARGIKQAKVQRMDGNVYRIDDGPQDRWEDRELSLSLSVEQLIDKQRYKEAVIAIERQLMNGYEVSWSAVIHLPQQYRQLSPFIMQAIGMKLWREGKLREAKEHIGIAIKGFASLYMPQLLLTNLANLAQLELRTGDYAAAQTIHMQLSAEYKQSGQLAAETRGAIAHCLAISDKSRSSQPADEVNVRECLTQQTKLYTEAIQAYEQLGQWEEACSIMIELACVAGEELEPHDWNALHSQCTAWSMRNAELTTYAVMLELLRAYYDKEWKVALERYSKLEQSLATIHYWISATVTAYALRASCQLRLQQAERGQGAEQAAVQSQAQAQQQMQSQEQSQTQPEEQRINIERYEQSLHHYIERYSSDYMLQYELMSSLLDCYKLLNRQDEVLEQRCSSLARLMGHCDSYEGSINHSSQAEMQQSAATVNHDNGWKLYLFGGLRFARGQQERRQLSWKRRKARELLLYLALQPHYSAVREQIIDKLQLGEPLDKANQQLYVIVHQLKRTLLTELGIEQGIIVQDGLIRLHEDTIEYVDVEHYLALTRVADQLWQFDRSLSYEMYEQAYLLYDELLPELPYVEWLEQYREFFTQKQISLLQKCLLHAEERHDWQHAEIYLRSWLTLKPFQEEAYAKLIDLLIVLDRISEAKQTYASWEKSCREELGTVPSFTPNFK